jgi:hypothetical protein
MDYKRKYKIENEKVFVTTTRKEENITIIKKVILTKEQIKEQLTGCQTGLGNINSQIKELKDQQDMAKKDVKFFNKVLAKLTPVVPVQSQEGVG